jgi:rRNA maturation endonuclease Nob1
VNRWASRNPEAMDEIAGLPPSQQNEALKSSIGLGFRSWCHFCGQGFTDPYETKMCPDCGGRAGVFNHRDETEPGTL